MFNIQTAYQSIFKYDGYKLKFATPYCKLNPSEYHEKLFSILQLSSLQKRVSYFFPKNVDGMDASSAATEKWLM